MDELDVVVMKEGYADEQDNIGKGILVKGKDVVISITPFLDFEEKENTITLGVVDSNDGTKGVEGIKVKLFSEKGELLEEKKTDGKGRFTSKSLNKEAKIYFVVDDERYEIIDTIFDKKWNKIQTITLEVEGRVYFPYLIYVKKK